MIIPTDPRIRQLAVQAVRDQPGKTFKDIAKAHGLHERTLRRFAKEAGDIHRKQGVKSWRLRVHPRDWTAEQRRIAHREGVLADGLAVPRV
jgi:predicted transcriptional regulator